MYIWTAFIGNVKNVLKNWVCWHKIHQTNLLNVNVVNDVPYKVFIININDSQHWTQQ